jgi:hypothetical protein
LLLVHFYTLFNPSCLDVQRVRFCSEMYCHVKQNGGGELYSYCFVWNVSRIQISRFVCTSVVWGGGLEYLCVVIFTEEISVQSELGGLLLILMEGQLFGKK